MTRQLSSVLELLLVAHTKSDGIHLYSTPFFSELSVIFPIRPILISLGTFCALFRSSSTMVHFGYPQALFLVLGTLIFSLYIHIINDFFF